MRWIDIILPEPGHDRGFESLILEAGKALPELDSIQERDGIDSPNVTAHMAAVGRLLFQAVVGCCPEAFSPDPDRAGSQVPGLNLEDHDGLIGFHLVAAPELQPLPWVWLHNGLGFLFQKHPICVGGHPSLPDRYNQRPWMQRLVRSGFMVGPAGESSLNAICAQVRHERAAPPELLFIPGHADRTIRRLIFREAEAITEALAGGSLGKPLATIRIPDGAVTPADLAHKSLAFQAIHYAGPTSEAVQYDASESQYWMNQLIEEASQTPDRTVDDMLGIEGEVLGVDPITSLLDDIADRYDTTEGLTAGVVQDSAQSSAAADGPNAPSTPTAGKGGPAASWLLDDGPIGPERFEKAGGMPPLVFSNSYCSLPHLGGRFALAGASTFIGPVAPLFSRPARRFAGHTYAALAGGWCAGAAVWRAATACRSDLGTDHPAWLSYGIQGYGSLALQYL